MIKNRITALLTAAVMATVSLLLCSCSASQTEAVQSTGSEPAAFAVLGEQQEGRKNIYVIVKSLESSYWQVIKNAAEDASGALGCNVFYSGTNNETEWENQQALMEIAINDGADAILLAPNDSVKLSPIVEKTYQSGIPIILIDTVANTQQYSLCYMTDNLMAGQNAAEEMLYHLRSMGISEDEPARIAIQVGTATSQTINERLAGFCQYWSKNAPKKWEIIDEVKCNQGSAEQAVVCAEEFFDEYSHINGVFGSNNGSTSGFAKIIKQRELKDVAIVGFDYSADIEALINDPEYHASTMLQRQYDMCYEGIDSALKMLDGDFSKNRRYIDTGVTAVRNDLLSDPEIAEIISRN